MVLLASRHCLAEEVEVLRLHLIAEQVSRRHHDIPLHVGLFLGRCHCGEHLIGTLHEVGLSEHEFSEVVRLHAFCLEQFGEFDMRIRPFKLVDGHFVVVGLHIAQFGTRFRHLGQPGLHVENGVHFLLSHLLLEAEEAEHTHDMFLISLAYGGGSLIVVEIIFFLSEHETALIDIEDVHLGVLLVGAEIGAVGHAVAEGRILELYAAQGIGRLGLLNLVDERHGGRHALAVASCGVHGEFVEVAEFLLHASACGGFSREFGQDFVDAFVVVTGQAVETAEA